jgi:hypothetical protein
LLIVELERNRVMCGRRWRRRRLQGRSEIMMLTRIQRILKGESQRCSLRMSAFWP